MAKSWVSCFFTHGIHVFNIYIHYVVQQVEIFLR